MEMKSQPNPLTFVGLTEFTGFLPSFFLRVSMDFPRVDIGFYRVLLLLLLFFLCDSTVFW